MVLYIYQLWIKKVNTMAKSYIKRDPQQEITDKMIALIESGKLPWRKPWADRSGVGDRKSVV